MYKLSNRAAKDFEKIFEYTLLNFGVEQADDYTNALHQTLLTIADQPLMGHECLKIAYGLRCHDHAKHAIYYRPQSDGIYIIRILHHQMDPLLHFSR
ncbi:MULTISPECIES: type II toxin-antitoxin system RelE/ParE family toxin [unclassified Salinivibrio]|uniref:type II toxin-antitoxin system RelE/ParE family toxin n=1 Tax=unclassified Salinivibrio TaxID=2636825 RepID=UPI00128AF511|nr:MULTISPECIES: type II toxin-antitoxin system RelE/ParE family toxin [unclassified Salinivibrio]MPS32435.1 type II toxin-antitoxin system RelE/ParE family toxin [Salinivibrio sp. VYel7]MPX90642.1 type II toxin-antitoxin system RelE/ParE family toxin [Salinivibrio sp. VYel1]MPX93828.1 type II toxin-antitoxin system RelE/ParE family toxin [Salinivibrio sp. VYel9]MPX96065.1 type II toxin-antitoxin system RelE/ParE family toxin [Salinivibrio sp. VYel6]MPY00293.1 type II toxin-antitoxin system Re